MVIALWSIIFIASLVTLGKAADYFTEYAEKLGKILRLPNFVIGVVIVAIGTSLPELLTSVLAVSRGDVEFLSANVLGTVIVNLLLGLSFAIILTKKKARFNWDVVSNDLPFFGAAIFLVIISLMDGKFSFVEAVVFLMGFATYLLYIYYTQKTQKESREILTEEVREKVREVKPEKFFLKFLTPNVRLVLYLLVSLGVVALASTFVVESVLKLADLLNLGTSVLAASAVATGTSLPEILVAIAAARRGNFDMVIGNILGSNIFDIFVIFGVTGLFVELTISMSMFMILMPFLLGAFFLLWLMLVDKKITKTEAALFVLLYIMFTGKLFNLF